MTVLTGCAWRTQRAEHVFGPTLYRFHQNATNLSVVSQTAHFPVLMEGGTQWGLSLGYSRRLSLTPRPAPASLTNSGLPSAWGGQAKPGRWQWSWLYLRAPLQAPPFFIARGLVGLQAGAGTEESALSLGYSSMTSTRPEPDSLYSLDYDSRRPLEASVDRRTFATNQTQPPTR